MALTDMACRKAVAREKPYKLADSAGLHLYVTATGFRSWRFKYRIPGPDKLIEKQLSFGPYPEVPLEEARARRDEARRLLRTGVDPAVEAKQRRAAAALEAVDTFELVAREWHLKRKSALQPRYARQVLERLEKHVFPMIGGLPIRQVTVPLVLAVVRKVEDAGAIEMAHRVRGIMSDVFVYAIGAGRGDSDPAALVRKALRPTNEQLRPAMVELDAARRALAAAEEASVHWALRLASRLVALTAVRPGVVILASRDEFEDLYGKEPLWRIPAARMKLTTERKQDSAYDFVVPLSTHAAEVVKAALVMTNNRALLFPSYREPRRPISESSLSKLYRSAGLRGKHVPHGWRATFSTIMNELAAVEDRDRDRAIIDMMLAHIQGGVEAVYNRAAYMPRRRELAQRWGDMLMPDLPPAAELIRRR